VTHSQWTPTASPTTPNLKMERFSSNTLGTNITGSFTFTQVGPGAGLLVETFTNLSTTNVFNQLQPGSVHLGGSDQQRELFHHHDVERWRRVFFQLGSFNQHQPSEQGGLSRAGFLAGLSAAVTSQATGGTSAASTIAFTVTFGEATRRSPPAPPDHVRRVRLHLHPHRRFQCHGYFKYFAPPQSASFAVTNFLFFSSRDLVTYVNAKRRRSA